MIVGLLGCAPALVDLPAPDVLGRPPQGAPVAVAWPVDARPAPERAGGGFYDSTLPVPFVTHGDVNLRPSPLGFVDRATRTGLAWAGVPEDPAADVEVRVYVLHLAGSRDVSDAQWVSTLTGGVAGTFGKFIYPAFFEVRGAVRVEVRGPAGVIVRDVDAYAVREVPVARTWGVWSLFRRDVAQEQMTDAFVEVEQELLHGIGLVVVGGREGLASGGDAPTANAFTSLDPDWRSSDTFELRGAYEDERALAKYGHARFSLWTGHDTDRGDVVGQLGLPLDTFGYDIGVYDRVQAHVDLTVLGLYNGASGGARVQVIEVGDTKLSVEGWVGLNVALPPERRYVPELAALSAGGAVMVSARPKEITWFASAGLFGADVRHSYDAFGGVEEGDAYGVRIGPGFELQVTPTAVVGLKVEALAQVSAGTALRLTDLPPVVLVPQIGLGLR